jgi:hypothetical protein
MKTKYYFFAALATVMLASCADDQFVGDNSPTTGNETEGSIQFALNTQNATRAGEFVGATAAEKLGNNFYVTGTKGTEGEDNPTPTLVFDNYLVHYGANTAGGTESNTNNWEYVGIDQTVPTVADHVKLSSTTGAQTIKYWDYSTSQYDFLAFSTGNYAAVSGSSTAATNIGVTAMKYGTTLTSGATAYTFDIPSTTALKQAYISDIVEVPQANYGKVVQLKFKSLGSKIRMALYETVPGYSVKDVIFYTVDGTTDLTDTYKSNVGKLISADDNGIPTKGKVNVIFNHVGTNNDDKDDYNKASATITIPDASPTYDKYLTFSTLAAPQLKAKERAEAGDDNVFLGRTLPNASFVGDPTEAFYQIVFPVNSPSALTLRVDYTLVPIDGAAETIEVKGAKAVVPSTYTKWLPNYAYTYVFKISDNTNGWTGATSKDPGLFPITFDAVVAQINDATAEQTTVTTVATPSITTYQQGHTYAKDEYSRTQKAGASASVTPDVYKDLYVRVMDNSTTTPTLKEDLKGAGKSLLFKVTAGEGVTISEATVMDALQNRTNDPAGDGDKASYKDESPVGRNGITLTKDTHIANDVTTIENGVDDQPITGLTSGSVAKIDIDQLTSSGTYAYVYSTTVPSSEEKVYHVAADASTNYAKYYEVTLAGDGNDAVMPASSKAVAGKVYFIINKKADGSFDSYTFKQTKIDDDVEGLVEASIPADKASTYTSGHFYFDVYYQNNGKYAVKVIKVVD